MQGHGPAAHPQEIVRKGNGLQIVGESALLQVSVEDASRTGTSILYNARANPHEVGPVRTRIVLTSMIVAIVVLSILILCVKVVRENA